MLVSSSFKLTIASALLVTLVACKSTQERADGYFESGVTLIESGDPDRAIVEFRNAFELDPTHEGARKALARLMMDQNNIRGAYGQYLTLVEQYPNDMEGRLALTKIAFSERDWEEFERHGTAAVELDPENIEVKAISLGLRYRQTVLDKDDPAREALLSENTELLAALPDSAILNNLLIDNYTRTGALGKALERLDILIADAPGNRRMLNQRLAILSEMQDFEAIEAQLRDMVQQFPTDPEPKSMLLRYYVSRNKVSEAEDFLREISDPAAEDATYYNDLIRFVSRVRGPEAARAEIERAIAVNPKPDQFRAMLAMLDFQAGEQDAAVETLETIIAGTAEPSEDLDKIKIILARMNSTTGNQVGASRLVEEVLANDGQQVEALKMQAAWQLQADETDAAISSLRLVLDVAPEDVQAMNLMAEAYFRIGNTDLARDLLALAVDASGNAPDATIRYAGLLIEEGRLLPAEDILLPALRLNPRNIALLNTLGELYLRMEDEARMTQVIDTLKRIDNTRATSSANRLQLALLEQNSGTDEAMQFLENLANSESGDVQNKLTLVRARLAIGEFDEALRLVRTLVAENPDDPFMRFALGSTLSASGDVVAAERTFRDLVEEDPTRTRIWMELSRLRARQGDLDGSAKAVRDGLAAVPEDSNLLWANASILERNGDIDGAIAIYEGLYERNSNAMVIANNLASLLATHRTDDASLEQAWTMARRLRDSDVAAFQDTYGWIAFRRGEVEEALPYLENAAQGLPQDAVVQVHLGLAYAAAERNEEALEQLQKAITLAGPADSRPQIERARAEVTRLRDLVPN